MECVYILREFLEQWHELPTKHIYLLDLLRLHTPVFTICKVEDISMLIFLFFFFFKGVFKISVSQHLTFFIVEEHRLVSVTSCT